MNRCLMPVGRYAENPYYVEKVFVNVYSAEELCYALYENAFLLDRDILDIQLVNWIDRELGLKDLARQLIHLVNTGASASAFVGTILSYVGYYTKDEVSKAESILRLNVSMNAFERMKARADFLTENKHFVFAIREYRKLLSILPEEDHPLLARVYNNLGITYMNLYLFDAAEKCFLRAYEENNDETAYRHYLTVKRLSLSDDEYVKFIADTEGAYKTSISLESSIEEIRHAFDDSDKAEALRKLFELRTNGSNSLYYEEMENLTESLKEDYRDFVMDTEGSKEGAKSDI